MKTLWSEDGQALIITLLSLTILLGFAGLATDVGVLFYAKRQLQTAADSAAIAGASEANFADWKQSALNDAATNGATNGTNGFTVTVNHPYTPQVCGATCNPQNYVEVIVSQTQNTLFMSLFKPNPVTVAARAVAHLQNSPGCIFTLDPSAANSLYLNGFLIFLNAPNCAIYIDSSSGNALRALFLDSITAKSIGIVGNYSSGFFNFINPTPVTGIVPVSDPLAYLQPPAVGGCTFTNKVVTTGMTLNPGTYCGTGGNPAIKITSAALVTLNPGTYILNGGGSATGGLLIQNTALVSGHGVTFYITNGGSFDISGFGVTLTAPGPAAAYPGILFFQDRSDISPASIGAILSFVDLEGAIYLPAGKLTFPTAITGTFSNYGIYVAKNIEFDGILGLFQDYATAAGSGGTSPIKGVSLVE